MPRARRSLLVWYAPLAVLSGSSCNLAPPIDIDSAVLVLPVGDVPAVAPYALYFTLHNRGNADVAVTGVTIDSGGTAELRGVTAHRMPVTSTAAGTRTIMQEMDRVDVPRHARVSFAPGGHTVFVTPTASGWPHGATVPFTVQLSSAWTVRGRARVLTFAEFDARLDSAQGVADGAVADRTVDSRSPVAHGERLYRANGCIQCHGAEGNGDGPLAATLQPPPRNFRQPTPYANGGTPEAIARTLSTGLSAGGAMPLYPHLRRSERLAIASYVLSLADRPADSNTGRGPGSEP
jgi:mono/diheme cytochrome c family protein/copper(I)-binding protein